MRKIMMLLPLLLCSWGCDDPKLSEFREVRKTTWDRTESSSWGAFFFMVGGSAGGSTTQELKVYMYRKNTEGMYQLIAAPMTEVRVLLDESVKVPLVAIMPSAGSAGYPEQTYLDSGWWKYVVIKCNPEDWKLQVRLPLEDKDRGREIPSSTP